MISNKQIKPIFVGVVGGSASGKTTICYEIIKKMGDMKQHCTIISSDCFYTEIDSTESDFDINDFNFDHPGAFDWDLM